MQTRISAWNACGVCGRTRFPRPSRCPGSAASTLLLPDKIFTFNYLRSPGSRYHSVGFAAIIADMRRVALLVFVSLAGAVAPLSAQDAAAAAKASPYVSVIGTIEKVDTAGKALTVKPDKGDNTTVKFDERTSFMTIAA